MASQRHQQQMWGVPDNLLLVMQNLYACSFLQQSLGLINPKKGKTIKRQQQINLLLFSI